VKHYPYFHKDTKTFDFDGMTQTLNSGPKGSIVGLHACAHNPTGVDQTDNEWWEIAKIMKTNDLFPFFDGALIRVLPLGISPRTTLLFGILLSKGSNLLSLSLSPRTSVCMASELELSTLSPLPVQTHHQRWIVLHLSC
jgi:hypothetical protein